jgi:hypothetical protein
MTSELELRLTEAIDRLTKPRMEHTPIPDSDGKWLRVESVEHPSLIETLMTVPGGTKNGGSSDPGLPIDADALEILGQISDHLSLWSRHLKFEYRRRELVPSLIAWHSAHSDLVRDGHISFEAEQDVVRTVESWVRMIENKFEPDNVDEFKESCPMCGARRVVIDEHERFAIKINWTRVSAKCANCNQEWHGVTGPAEEPGLRELRYMANLADDARKDALAVADSQP